MLVSLSHQQTIWAQQMPTTCENRGGRFSVKCPGNKEILAMLLEMFAVHCTFFCAEYLPAIISFFYVLALQKEACAVQSRRIKPWNKRDGVLEMIHCPGGGWRNMDALMTKDGGASFASLYYSAWSSSVLLNACGLLHESVI